MVVGRGAGGFLRATVMSAGLAIGPHALAIGPIRKLAKRFVPAPGEGPSKEEREGGSFTDEGASGVTAPYRLQVSKQPAGNSLRLYAPSLSAAAPVAKAVEQCR